MTSPGLSGTLSCLVPFAHTDVPHGAFVRLRTVVESRPDQVAVVDAHLQLTYSDLAGRVAGVAEALWTGGESAAPVAMLCGHDGPAVATALGVMLSGRPLLVLDPLTPAPRLRGFVERLQIAICIADTERTDLATNVISGVGGRVLATPAAGAHPDWSASPAWRHTPDPARVGVLGFTSGSTGRPKVVALDHRHLAGDAWACSTASGCIQAGDVLAHTLPMAFAAGMNVTLAGPLAGATLAMYDTRALGIAGLAAWIDRTGVTVMNASPAILRSFVASRPAPQLLRRVRSLTLGGEAAHGGDVAAARALLPRTCSVYHRLGSTETGLVAELRLGPADPTPTGPLPVGLPIGPTRLRLVDDAGHPVPQGQPGILDVTRSWLASGYWQDPERTAERFCEHLDGTRTFRSNDVGRFDEAGRLQVLGRRDHSVKIRGYLVEPGEVDAVLHAHPDVVEAVTVGRPRSDGVGHRLVTYLVSSASRLSAAAVRADLRTNLPSHMVPELIVFCDALPRNDRGKIDRAALPDPTEPAGGEPPISEWENVVAQAWARALQLDDVLRDADFFQLGGDSLAAEALISTLVSDLGIPAGTVSTTILTEAPTVAQFARRLRRKPERGQQTVSALNPRGTLPPLFLVAGGGGLGVGFLPVGRHLGSDQPVYALQAHALERRGLPDWSVRAIARRHLSSIRSIQAHGPFYLAGHSFGGIVAFEMAQQLRRAGEAVGLLTLMDSFPPDPALVPPGPTLSVAGQVKDVIGLLVTGLVPTPGIGQYWRFHRQSRTLASRYRSGPYPGRALVLLADSDERDARSQWSSHLCGPWEAVSVGGDHISMLRDPHAAVLAEVLATALARARADLAVEGKGDHASPTLL